MSEYVNEILCVRKAAWPTIVAGAAAAAALPAVLKYSIWETRERAREKYKYKL